MITLALIGYKGIRSIFFESASIAAPRIDEPRSYWFLRRWGACNCVTPPRGKEKSTTQEKDARKDDICRGKQKVINVEDDSFDDEPLTIPLWNALDIPVYSRSRAGIVIC